MSEPLVLLERDYPSLEFDRHWLQENRASAARRVQQQIPHHYANAVATNPEVVAWVRAVVRDAVEASGPVQVSVTRGPSLLLLGPTGTGKTFEAFGALRALAESGVSCAWTATTAADMYARLRPRHRVDSEEEFERYLKARVLVVDDLGAAKASEFTEEVNYRLINHRYEREMPTLITSNVLPRDLAASVGERVASRLTEMAGRVVLGGADRRRPLRAAYDPDERIEARRDRA
jgi:DNA replication protein DnaC